MQNSHQQRNHQELSDALIISMCAPLMNMIKLCLQYPSKNKFQAEKPDLICAIEILGQYLLPDYCLKHANDLRVLNQMHNMIFLLSIKARKVFQSSVIAAAITNNSDLEAFKRCLYEILACLQAKDTNQLKKAIQSFFDEWKNDQINKNDACLQKIYHLLEQNQKEIIEKDVINITNSFETDFEFLQSDFINFRMWNFKQDSIEKGREEFLSKEYSFQSELKNHFHAVYGQDEFLNFSELFNSVKKSMGNSLDSKVAWLTFFKTEQSCSAISFIEKIQMLCVLNDVYELELIQSAFPGQSNWNQLIDQFNYVINFQVSSDATNIINKFVDLCLKDENRFGFCLLRNQISFSQKAQKMQTPLISDSIYKKSKGLSAFASSDRLSQLSKLSFYNIKDKHDRENVKLALRYIPFDQKLQSLPEHQLQLKIGHGKNVQEMTFTGERPIFSIGNGDNFDLNFPFEPRFIDSQIQILQKEGKYFFKDCGKLINMVSRLDGKKQERLYEGTVIDFGRSIKYHCTKCISPQWSEFGIIDPVLEAIHFNFDEKTPKQPKIIFKVDKNMKNQKFTVGRAGQNNSKDLLLTSSSINTHQCTIEYEQGQGWTINEIGQKQSAKGTFVYLKNFNQYVRKEPSNSIELNQNYDYLIGYSQTTDYQIKFQLKYQSADINQYNDSLKNRRLTLSKTTLARHESSRNFGLDDSRRMSHPGPSSIFDTKQSMLSQILPTQTSRVPSETIYKETENDEKNIFDTEEDIRKEVEVQIVDDELFQEPKPPAIDSSPFQTVRETPKKDSQSPEDLRKQIMQNFVADQESFLGDQSMNVLNQTETAERLSIGKKSNVSRTSHRFSIASIVKTTQLKFTSQISQPSPSSPSAPQTIAQQMKSIQPLYDPILSGSPVPSSPLLLSPQKAKKNNDIIDHRMQVNDSVNLTNLALSQYASIGKESENPSLAQNLNTSVSTIVMQKQLDSLKQREQQYIQELRQQKTELDEIKPKLAEKIMENQDLKNQIEQLNKSNEKLTKQLKQAENYIESKKWEKPREEQEESSKLLDLSKEDSRNLLLNSIQFEVPEVDEEEDTEELADSIIEKPEFPHRQPPQKILTPSNTNRKKLINFNESELTFAGKDGNDNEFQDELNKFNTPRDDLSENQQFNNSCGEIQRIENVSEISQDNYQSSIKDNIEMLQTSVDRKRESILNNHENMKISQIQIEDGQNIDQNEILEQLVDAKNLIPNLQKIFEKLNFLKNKDIVMTVGYTGSGKSTLLTSLIFGSESLCKKEITRQKSKMNSLGTSATNQTRSITDRVIDITDDSPIHVFQIGHEKTKSKTFIPSVAEVTLTNSSQQLYFIDTAGFFDSRGTTSELFNCLIIKHILNQAKSVRFLMPMTHQSLLQNRGMDVRCQIELIQSMYNSSEENSDMHQFIQPLLTKCNINDDEIDLDEIRATFCQILQKCSEVSNNQQITDDSDIKANKLSALLSEKLQIFDPLDRPISSDNDQAIKRKDLLNRILNMSSVPQANIEQTMTNHLYEMINKLLSTGLKRCNDAIQHHVNKAKTKQSAYTDDISNDAIIQLHQSHLQFLSDHRLLADSADRLHNLSQLIGSAKHMIASAKSFNSLDSYGQQVFEFTEQIFLCKSQKQFDLLVQIMIELQKWINQTKLDQKSNKDVQQLAEMSLQCSKGERYLEDTVTEIARDPQSLARFAYELRKQDSSNEFSFPFLNGQVQPTILTEIIMQNQWNGDQQKLMLNSNAKFFRIYNKKFKSFIKYENQAVKIGQETQAIAGPISNTENSANLQFILTPQGFLIMNQKKQYLSLQDQYTEISQGTKQKLFWSPTLTPSTCHWLLLPSSPDSGPSPEFFIQLGYGNVKPRLQLSDFEKLNVTARNSKDYHNEGQVVWMILN